MPHFTQTFTIIFKSNSPGQEYSKELFLIVCLSIWVGYFLYQENPIILHYNKGSIITYLLIHIIHIFSVFIYGGFLITDNLILMRMQKTLSEEKYTEVRKCFALFTKQLVPKALLVAVASGAYLFSQNFGTIADDGLTNFQIVLSIKAFLGGWLGLRGILQVFFGIQPLIFTSHRFPFILVIIIIFLSQLMSAV